MGIYRIGILISSRVSTLRPIIYAPGINICMGNNMKYLFLFAVAVVLLLVICVEAFHLVNSHGCIDAAFQQEILEGIRDVSDRVAYADTEEDIVRVCDAKERLRLTKEQIMNELPKYKQGRYMNFLDGGINISNVVLVVVNIIFIVDFEVE